MDIYLPCWTCLQVAIPREQIYAIKENLPVAEAATEYAGQLLRLDNKVLPRNAEGACPPAPHTLHLPCSQICNVSSGKVSN